MKPIETKANAEKVVKNLGLQEPLNVTVSRAATIGDFGKTIRLVNNNVGLTLPPTLTKDGHIKVICAADPVGNRVITASGGTSFNINAPGVTYSASTSIYFEDNNIVSIDCYFKQSENKWYIQTNGISKVYDIMNYGAKGDGVTNDSAVVTAVIARAEPYSTILLPKTHKIENVVVNKSLKFVSAGPESQIVYTTSGSNVFILNGSDLDVEFINLDILFNGVWHNDINEAIGGNTGSGNSVTIRNCICKNASHLIYPGATLTLKMLIVEDCEIYYTHGRASGGIGNVDYTFPATAILAGATYTFIRNNFCNCLVDPTFTDVDSGAPANQRTPIDGFYKTAGYNPEVIVITGNTVLNFGIEGILVEKYPEGKCEALISNNVLVGSSQKSEYFYGTMPGILIMNCYTATVSNNRISNCFVGVTAQYTVDTAANVLNISNNTIVDVVNGIYAYNQSENSVISGNYIRCSSTHAKAIGLGYQGAYCELVGISAARGCLFGNTIRMEEPEWDLTLTLTGRASNVFTVSDATGVAGGGWLVGYLNGLYNAIPVTSVAGNDITCDGAFAAQVEGWQSGTIFYQEVGGNIFNIGAIVNTNNDGDTLECFENVIIGAVRDFGIANTGKIKEYGNKRKNVKVILPASDSMQRIGDAIIDGYLESRARTRQFLNTSMAPTSSFGYDALNNGSATALPSGLCTLIWSTVESSVVSNYSKGNVGFPVIVQPRTTDLVYVDWDKPMIASFNVAITAQGVGAPSSRNTFELLFGVLYNQTTVQNVGDGGLIDKGFGIRVRGETVYLLRHDGASQVVTELGAFTQGGTKHFVIKLDGTGNISVEVTGLGVFSLTGAPTGASDPWSNSILQQAWNITLADASMPSYTVSALELEHVA